MADTGILDAVKIALGITGTYQDATLNGYINEVKDYMISAGVPKTVANSTVSAGVISRGVTDLWNYNGGASKLSDYFYQRVTQLAYAVKDGKIISFYQGDYGISYLVHVCNVVVNEKDTLIFTCNEITKTYTNLTNNYVLITFTKEESQKLQAGTYTWDLKLQKESATVTVLNDGLLVVG